MKILSSVRRVLALVALALLAVALPASATSYVMMSDEALTDDAPIVALVKVVAVERSPAPGTPSTDYLVEIERLLKGYASGSTVVVRVEGGVRSDGLGLRIYGAPRFAEGNRGLLFLEDKKDGTYGLFNLMLGAFHEVAVAGGRPVAMRDLDGTTEVSKKADGSLKLAPGADRPRDLERFAAWIQERVSGLRRPADYFVALDAKGLQQVNEKFTTLNDPNTELPLRWFLFDGNSRATVTFRANENPQPGVPDSYTAFQAGLAAWTNDPDTPIRYLYGGKTAANGGLAEFDDVNSILFNDPNSEISTFNCINGGILAKGGPWYDSSLTGRFKNTTYIQSQGADIVVNNGLDCFFQASRNPQKAAEELFAHELGHTLGLGHSSEENDEVNGTLRDALMYFLVHDDGRGARLASDDKAAITRIYGSGSGGNGGNTGSKCTANANTLCLVKKRFRVQVDWQNQFNGTSGVGRAIPRTDATGFFSFGDPGNVELILKILNFGDVIKIFYGQLTNLSFTITVTDTQTGEVKTYANTPGECGGVDDNAFQSVQAASSVARLSKAVPAKAKAGTCKSDKDTLCLQANRFAIEVDWRNPGNNTSGKATSVSLSNVTGTFFFTDSGNIELMTKLLDFGDHFVFFYGTLTNLEFTIRVTDTLAGTTKTYHNAAGNFCGGLDNAAF